MNAVAPIHRAANAYQLVSYLLLGYTETIIRDAISTLKLAIYFRCLSPLSPLGGSIDAASMQHEKAQSKHLFSIICENYYSVLNMSNETSLWCKKKKGKKLMQPRQQKQCILVNIYKACASWCSSPRIEPLWRYCLCQLYNISSSKDPRITFRLLHLKVSCVQC